MTAVDQGAVADHAETGDAPAVWLLAIGQTLTYGCLYYVFAALIVTLEAGTGWSKTMLAAGPTLALLLTAALAPVAGRMIDRGHGPTMLVAGPLIGAVGLAVAALSATPAGWIAGWLVIGLAQAVALYETCFAFLTRRLGAGARAAITRVTLVAGFASTLAYPAGAWAGPALGWQGAVLVFALVAAGLAMPVNLWAVIRLRRRAALAPRALPDPPGALGAALGRRNFWLIAAGFGLMWLTHAMLMTYALPLFRDRGAGAALAVVAASAIGPAQVAGRVALLMAGARLGAVAATRIALGSAVVAVVLLAVAGAAPGLIFAFALVQGAANGVASILRPVVTADLLGREGFGAISGAIAVAPLAGAALAPVLGAWLIEAGGMAALIAACAAFSLLSALAAAGLRRDLWR